MTCSEGRWSCPWCRACVARPAGQSQASWQADLWLTQEVHGYRHTQIAPAQTTSTRKDPS